METLKLTNDIGLIRLGLIKEAIASRYTGKIFLDPDYSPNQMGWLEDWMGIDYLTRNGKRIPVWKSSDKGSLCDEREPSELVLGDGHVRPITEAPFQK